MFHNRRYNLYVLTNRLKVNLLEAIKMLKNPYKVSNTAECSKIEPQPDGIEWQATGTNLLSSDNKPIMRVEYFAPGNVYKSIFKLTGKHQYNATLINYAEYSNLHITDPPKNEIKKSQFVSRKRSIKSIMKDRFELFKKPINEEIVNDQSNIEQIKNNNFDPRTLGADFSLPGTSSSISTPDCSTIHPFNYLEHDLHEDDVIESTAFESNVSPNISFEVQDINLHNEPFRTPSTQYETSFIICSTLTPSNNTYKNFSDLEISNVESHQFQCDMCNIVMFINSEKSKPETFLPINDAAVNGSIAAGIGFTQLSELCAVMDIPCMSSSTFLSVQEFIAKKIHEVAEAQMKIAGDEERRLAIEAGSVDIDGIPMCTVVADGQWSKRSYKTKYDALSGVATIIGYRSKKILFVGIKNRFCVICQRAKNKKLHPSEHTCFLNWKKGATSMEADGIADGFKRSLEMHGLKYNKIIGDGDSSVTKRLTDIMPYGPRLRVIKIECRNHLLRNYGTKLRAMTLNTKYPISLRNHIKSNILRFRFSITKAIEYRNSLSGQTDYQKSVGLRQDIHDSM
ncbi:uncharacterized protein LOC111041936 [Myzus persicae]|uniref:uncharacterized protein LOC111041936 n=1 Tax=Myzus persicae TaxID=13164 RepID=UPI000B9305A5|nr:uncharacterized protein LOC111041936 [Myzus persicae]